MHYFTGLSYAKEIGMRVINRIIPRLQFPRITANIQPEGTVTITNMRVLDYWPPVKTELDMKPPDSFQWTMVNMGIRRALFCRLFVKDLF